MNRYDFTERKLKMFIRNMKHLLNYHEDQMREIRTMFGRNARVNSEAYAHQEYLFRNERRRFERARNRIALAMFGVSYENVKRMIQQNVIGGYSRY